MAACSAVHAEAWAEGAGCDSGAVQWPIAACSGEQTGEADGGDCGIVFAGAASVQCPIAACSGEHVTGAVGLGEAGADGTAVSLQCPIAACSGVQVAPAAGVDGGGGDACPCAIAGTLMKTAKASSGSL